MRGVLLGSAASMRRDASGFWTPVLQSDFTGVTKTLTLPTPWQKYDFESYLASPQYSTWYRADHAFVENNALVLLYQYESSGNGIQRYSSNPYDGNGGGWYTATVYPSTSGANAFPNDVIDHRTTFRMRVVQNQGTATLMGSHRNMPLYWPVSENQPVDGEEDYFESDPMWNALDGSGRATMRNFMHGNGVVDYYNGSYSGLVDLSQWHVYRFQRLGFTVTEWVDDMVNPLWTKTFDATSLPAAPKTPRFQMESMNNNTAPTGTTGYERIEIDYITIEVPA